MIDCFTFFNELDTLEIRLNTLAPYVDEFVLAECAVTHSGNPKRLYFDENKERFSKFNITHLVIPVINGTSWEREEYGREYLMNAIPKDEMVLISDVDEIPDMSTYTGEEGVFEQSVYYYFVNCFTGVNNWRGTVAVKNPPSVRYTRENKKNYKVVGGGWHFSTLGSVDDIKYKIESFLHTEMNTKEYKDSIANNRKNLMDRHRKFSKHNPNGPEYLLKHKEKYSLLWI